MQYLELSEKSYMRPRYPLSEDCRKGRARRGKRFMQMKSKIQTINENEIIYLYHRFIDLLSFPIWHSTSLITVSLGFFFSLPIQSKPKPTRLTRYKFLTITTHPPFQTSNMIAYQLIVISTTFKSHIGIRYN